MRLVRSFSILFIMVFLFCFSVSNVYAIDSSQLPSFPVVDGYNYFLLVDRLDMGYVKILPDGRQSRYALFLFMTDCPIFVAKTREFNNKFGTSFDADDYLYNCIFFNFSGPFKFYDLVDDQWVLSVESNFDWYRFGSPSATKDITPIGFYGNVEVFNLDGSVFYSPVGSDEDEVSDFSDVIFSIDELKQFLAIQFGFFIGAALAYTFLKFMYS